MPRRSLVLRSVAPLSAVALLTMLGNVTACLSDNAGTGGAAGNTTAAGSGPLSGASGSVATGTAGGGAGATANGSSGGSAGTGGNGGAAAVVPKICDSSLEAETMTHSTGEAVDMGWNIWAAGDISGSHSFKGGPTTITVTAKGSVVGGVWPHMKVHVAGKLAGEVDVNTDAWAPYPFKLTPSAGTADIKVEFTNDGTDDSGGDRNLYVDKVAFSENCDGAGSGSGGSAGGGNTDTTNPFAGATIYNDGGSPACSGKGSEPLLDKICSNPQGSWINGGDGGGAVSSIVGKAGSSIPVLVAYNIPNRDCGGASGGGASDSNAYKSWIDSFAGAIGSHKVAVILEPDALAHGECADDRFDTLAYAVTALKKQSGAHVYIDAGHAGWVDAGTMAGRLKSANIAAADGFSLNVSSFQTNGDSISYGSAISSQVGGKPFVIDTSRNGKGPSGSMWCNPPGRGLGSKPGSDTGNPLVHAFLWVKRPGESDGSSGECNGGPGAGQWFQSYAVELCKNAAF